MQLFSMRVFSETVPAYHQPIDLAYSPDGRLVATAGGSRAKIWDALNGNLRLELPVLGELATSVAFSPDGSRLVIGTLNGAVAITDAHSGKVITMLIGHQGLVQAVLFSQAGQQVITGSIDGTVKIWEVQSGQEKLTLVRRQVPITDLALSPDGSRLAVTSEDGTAHIYLLKVEELILLAQQRLADCLAFDECRKYLPASYCPVGS
jgi:WD40 repeat protein